jgi:RNA polymerase sigma-70 factor (ECF subfamily)
MARLGDGELIARSLRGDGRSFAAVFDRHYDRIWRYLARRAGASAADDLASEVFVRGFAARAQYVPAQSDAAPWLYGIATNLLHERARSETRRRRAYARATPRDAVDDGADAIAQRVDAGALGPALGAALSALSPDERDALLLLALTDLSYDGIAIALGTPMGTVRSRLHRARRRVQAELGGAGHPQILERTDRSTA